MQKNIETCIIYIRFIFRQTEGPILCYKIENGLTPYRVSLKELENNFSWQIVKTNNPPIRQKRPSSPPSKDPPFLK